ncbi:hypothetical protein Dimus_013936, partial [Dionaea muscipula]
MVWLSISVSTRVAGAADLVWLSSVVGKEMVNGDGGVRLAMAVPAGGGSVCVCGWRESRRRRQAVVM